VCYDLLGLTPNMRPKFVKRYASMFDEGKQAIASYCSEVKQAVFPGEEHSFGNVQRPAEEAPTSNGYGPTH
ncbi:MAG TPA: 3-methyl-2-oxobutanoate hydroxymethyltransferase, partial [Polyangiales bacterium]|nr:3-methyl-2-oxobutanoate hydroxymethyltransferase [Polyangiales bacterium]